VRRRPAKRKKARKQAENGRYMCETHKTSPRFLCKMGTKLLSLICAKSRKIDGINILFTFK
ncbi:MAG: hypothetical protein AB7V55_03660, partial [Oscillospiraceae bacterium]